MHLDTLTNFASFVVSLCAILGLFWKFIARPWLKGMAKEIVPDHDPDAPTMRAMQEQQTRTQQEHTETLKRIEGKFDERLTKVEGKVDALAVKVDDLGQRVEKLEQAAK